jgi:hypothetical protein
VTFANVVNDNLGGQIAAREQRQLSSFPAIMEIKCKRTMSGLQPGDVFKMTYAPVGIISMVVRVLATNFGTIDDNEITLSCMEDIFGMKDSLYAAPPFSTWYNQPDAEAGSGIYDYPTIIYNRSTEEQIISRLTGNVIYKR